MYIWQKKYALLGNHPISHPITALLSRWLSQLSYRSTFSLAWPPLASTETLQLVRPMAIGLTSVAVLGAMQQEMKEMMQKEWASCCISWWEDKNDGCILLIEEIRLTSYDMENLPLFRSGLKIYLRWCKISEPSTEKNARSLRFLFVDRKMLGVRGHACDRAIGL